MQRDIVVVGASAGGFEAIKQLVSGLPRTLDAAIFIVWHMSSDVRGILPDVLNRMNTLPAANAVNLEDVKPGRIYVAPPDRHLMLETGKVRTTRGPKENRFRPAIDPLFRSAAVAYGQRVIGIVLSGALDDGSAGLFAIKRYGGMAIVQDPADAEVPSMPANARRVVDVDFSVSMAEMPGLIARLTSEEIIPGNSQPLREDARMQNEIKVAMEDRSPETRILDSGTLTPYTCPECHGVLSAIHEGNILRFRCHTGHAFSADSLLASITEGIEEGLWSAVRNINESVILLNHMGDHFAEANQPRLAAMYFKKAHDAHTRGQIVRRALVSHE